MKLVHKISFVLFLALALAACAPAVTAPTGTGGESLPPTQAIPAAESQPPAQASPIPDACALLTKADAEMLLNQPVGESERPIQGSATFHVDSCAYRAQTDQFTIATLIVTVPVDGSLQAAQTAFDIDKSQARGMLGADPVEVPALGDTAYWVGGMGNQLNILKGNLHIILGVDAYTGDQPPQPVVDFARALLGQIP